MESNWVTGLIAGLGKSNLLHFFFFPISVLAPIRCHPGKRLYPEHRRIMEHTITSMGRILVTPPMSVTQSSARHIASCPGISIQTSLGETAL